MNQRWKNIFNKQHKILTAAKQIELLTHLTSLLKFGFTLYDSFQFLNLQFKYNQKGLADNILTEISNGASCHQILQLLGFSRTVIMQIYLAEKYGDLITTLEETTHYLIMNRVSRQRLIKTLQYPIVLIIIFMLMLFILNITVIPQFQQLYTTMNIELSVTQMVLSNVITHLPLTVFILVFTITILVIIMRLIYAKLDIARQIKLMIAIPIVAKYYKLLRTYQITNELALFFKNGINLQAVVNIYLNFNDDRFRQYIGQLLLDFSHKGYTLPQILQEAKCFEMQLIKFIRQGEKRGKLDLELKLYSQVLVNQIESRAKRQISIIQPIVFIILGAFIVSLYLVIMLPMFQMMQSIK